MAFWELQPWDPSTSTPSTEPKVRSTVLPACVNGRTRPNDVFPSFLKKTWLWFFWVMKKNLRCFRVKFCTNKNHISPTIRSEGHALKAISYTWDQKFQDQCKRHETSTLLEMYIYIDLYWFILVDLTTKKFNENQIMRIHHMSHIRKCVVIVNAFWDPSDDRISF